MRLVAAALGGLAAVGFGYVVDVAWWALAGAAVAWSAAIVARGGWRIALLLAAPFLLTAGATDLSPGVESLASALALAALALTPLVAYLGAPSLPLRAIVVAACALAVPAALFLVPGGRLVLESDLGGGALVLALAAGTLVGGAAVSPGGRSPA